MIRLLLRAVALAVLAVLAMVWMLGAMRTRRVPTAGRGEKADPPRHAGSLVRDRVCNTFVVRSHALSVRHGGEEHFFCSEKCRSLYLADPGRREARAAGV